MKNSFEPDPKLSALLRESLPAPELPPGFQSAVWRRLEREESRAAPQPSWLDALANWLLAPRYALAVVTALVVLGAVVGSLQGLGNARALERDRYVATVSPAITH